MMMVVGVFEFSVGLVKCCKFNVVLVEVDVCGVLVGVVDVIGVVVCVLGWWIKFLICSWFGFWFCV